MAAKRRKKRKDLKISHRRTQTERDRGQRSEVGGQEKTEGRPARIKSVIASRKKEPKRWRNDPQISQIDADLKMKDQRTYRIIGKRGFKAPILVTSAYHMKRAVFLFEKQGTEIGGQRTEDRGRKAEKRIGEIGKISMFLIFCQGLRFWKNHQRHLRNIWG